MQMTANLKTLSVMPAIKKDTCVKNKAKNEKGKARQAQVPTHHVEEDEGDAACAFNMFVVDTNEEPPMPYYATVTVEGMDIKFEIDSGAMASVISEETYRRTWKDKPPPIKPSTLRLRTYAGQAIPHLGVLCVNIST